MMRIDLSLCAAPLAVGMQYLNQDTMILSRLQSEEFETEGRTEKRFALSIVVGTPGQIAGLP